MTRKKPFPKYDPIKFDNDSKEHEYFWQGVTSGGDIAKDEVQWLIDELTAKGKPVPYEYHEVMRALKDAFEDK